MAKKVKDIVNVKHLTNPVSYIKDTAKSFKKSPLQGAALLSMPGIGRGLMPDVVTNRINSKGKYEYQGGEYYDTRSTLLPQALPNPVPEVATPTAEAPLAARGRSVQDSVRQAKLEAGRRRGLLSTILSQNKGVLGGTGSTLG